MTDLRERLVDAAATPTLDVDVDRVKHRGATLRRRRAIGRAALPAVAVLALGAALLVGSDGDDQQPTLTDDQVVSTTTMVLPALDDPDPEELQPDASTSTTRVANAPEHVTRLVMFGDPAGDTRATDPWAVPGTTRHPEPDLDIVSGYVGVDADGLIAQVEVDDLGDAMPPGADGGSYDVSFTIWDDGEQLASFVHMQRYDDVVEVRVVVYAKSTLCTVCTVTFDADADRITATVPFAAIDDLLHDQGYDGLDAGDRLAGPGAETRWVHTDQIGEGSYSAARADVAAGPGRSLTL